MFGLKETSDIHLGVVNLQMVNLWYEMIYFTYILLSGNLGNFTFRVTVSDSESVQDDKSTILICERLLPSAGF